MGVRIIICLFFLLILGKEAEMAHTGSSVDITSSSNLRTGSRPSFFVSPRFPDQSLAQGGAGSHLHGLLPKSPGANIKEFLLTILSEAERPQT